MDKFLDRLDRKVQAKVEKWFDLLEETGPNLSRPYADVIEGPIRELRVGFGHLEIRLLYFFSGRTIIVMTHGFLKKTRAVPPEEIQRALRARTEWLIRYGGE